MFDGKAFGAEMTEIVKSYVERATAPLLERIAELEARPVPTNGKDGVNGIDGRDGVGVAGALVDRSGVLVLTLSDGTTRELGPVVGKDGQDGKDGENGTDGAPGVDGKDGNDGQPGADGKDGEPGRDGRDGTDGQDGAPGKDGLDGFGFDDLTVEQRGERVIALRFLKDDRVKEFEISLPVLIDRGVFKADREEPYRAGDGVTWAGSYWIAQKETKGKPGEGDDWRLAVKKGRDGKDAKLA